MKKRFLLFAAAVLAARFSFAVVGSPLEKPLLPLAFEAPKAAAPAVFLIEKAKKPRLIERFLAKKLAAKALAKAAEPSGSRADEADRLAKSSLVLGLLGWAYIAVRIVFGAAVGSSTAFFFYAFLGILAVFALLGAVVLGGLALKRETSRRPTAKAGLILGAAFFGLIVLGLLALLIFQPGFREG